MLPDQHLVLMSDSAAYVSAAAEVARGRATRVLDVAGVESLAKVADEPATAVQWTSTFACEDLSMGSADEGDQRVGDRLVAAAGKISPLDGPGDGPAGRTATSWSACTSRPPDQASENLQTRVDLASGAAPGQGGSFADRFRVTSGHADGQDVVLTLTPRHQAGRALRHLHRPGALRHLLTRSCSAPGST